MKELSRIFSVFVPDVVRWRGMSGGGDRRGKGKEKERKWREKGEKVKVKKWMVNEVNGERGEFDEYGVCSEWQKGQKVKSDFT